MATLLAGRMGRAAYASLIFNLLGLYTALESNLARNVAHPALAPIDLAGLTRAASLRGDLASLADALDTAAAPRPATVRYVDRLHELGAGRPELLLSHAYVRYLGDLSGGQLLGRVIVRSPALAKSTGTAFYEFVDATALARAFRLGLDQAVVADEDAVVAEAQRAFGWHVDLFDELAVDAVGTE